MKRKLMLTSVDKLIEEKVSFLLSKSCDPLWITLQCNFLFSSLEDASPFLGSHTAETDNMTSVSLAHTEHLPVLPP